MSEFTEQIGVYKIIKILGAGELGTVYLVEDLEGGGKYALKLLSSNLSPNDSRLRRFRREFLTLSRLRHPNIVEVYESGIYRDALFFVMEYIEGPTLRKHFLAKRPTKKAPPQEFQNWNRSRFNNRVMLEILKISKQIADALSFIHNYNIVHRDLKPENILLKSGLQAKLLDFGIATRLGQSEITDNQNIMGTLTYISPEQIQCDEIDGRSDLYTFGVILYELLAGRPPFISEEPIGCLYLHLNEKPLPPSLYNPYIDRELEDLILRLLSKNPLDRPQRAEELCDFFDAMLVKYGHEEKKLHRQEIKVTDPSFTGRDLELKSLLHQIEQLQRERTGSVAIISGISGIGKTRLAREAVAFARIQQIETCSIRCLPDSPPYTSYQELAEQLLTSLAVRDDKLPRLIWGDRLHKWLEQITGDLSLSIDLDTITPDVGGAESERYALVEGFCEILRLFLEREPLAIFFDDVTFIDEASLELTEYLIENLLLIPEPYPLLITFIFRSEDMGPEHPFNKLLLKLYGKKDLIQLYELKPLSREEILQFAISMVGLPPDETALKQLEEQSQGIPLFIEELIKAWNEDKQLLEAGDRWYLLSTAYREIETEQKNLQLPPTLLKRLRRRLERLSRPAKQLAIWLAVFGKEISYEFLRDLSQYNDEKFLTAIEELLQHKIAIEDWSRGEESYRIAHPGWTEVILESLSQKERENYHFQIAKFIKDNFQEERFLEILGYHFYQARQIGQAAWYYLLAAERNLRAMALLSAKNHLERCEKILREYPDDHLLQPPSSWWVRYQLARLEWLDYRGEYKKGLEELNQIQELIGKGTESAPFWYWQSRFSRQLGDFRKAISYIQKALETSPPHSEWRSPILQEAGKIFRVLGKWNLAVRALKEAIEWSKNRSLPVQEGRLIGAVGEIFHQLGRFEKASEHYYHSLEIANQNNDNFGKIEALCRLAILQFDRADLKDSLKLAEEALQLAQKINIRQLEVQPLVILAQIAIYREEYEKASSILERALELTKKINISYLQSEILFQFGLLNFFQKNYSEAMKFFERSAQLSSQIGLSIIKTKARAFAQSIKCEQNGTSPELIASNLSQLHTTCEKNLFIENSILINILRSRCLRKIGEHSRAEKLLSLCRFTAQHFGFYRLLSLIEKERYFSTQSE